MTVPVLELNIEKLREEELEEHARFRA